MSKVKPKANSIMICDNVLTEEGTNKKSLIGIFEHILSSQFPCVHGALSLYVKLTDAAGEYTFHLELYDLEQNKKLGEGTTTPISIKDRHDFHEVIFKLMGLVFEHPGKYEFRLFANGEYIDAKTFNVVQHKGGIS